MARSDLQGQTGGGGISDFEFLVTDAWFGTSEAFEKAVPGANQIFLHWVGQTDLEDHPVLTEEGFHPNWKVGPDWEIRDNGKRIEYVGSGTPRFRKSMGRLCDEVFAITESVADTDQDPFAGDNHPKDATVWIGTKWYMAVKHYEFGGGSDFKADDLMPVRYLGKQDVSSATTAAATASATTPATAAAASNGAPPDLVSQVENLARAMDYGPFQAAALQIPGVAAHADLVAEIADQSKLYARVRG